MLMIEPAGHLHRADRITTAEERAVEVDRMDRAPV